MSNSAKENNITLENVGLDREAVVDSTAPHNQLIQELLQRERYSKAYKFYHQLMAQRNNALSKELHYQILGYPLRSFRDGWNGSISKDYFEQFHFRSTMPNIISKMHYIEKSDPVTATMRIKYDWQHGNNVYRSLFLKAYGTKLEQQLSEDVMECPKYLIELAARLESDPDPNFDESYNWYYAGNGNLQLVCVNWVDYLLHSEFTSVYLTRFFKQNVNIEEEYTAIFDCGEDMHILETVCSPNNIVAVRTKNTIFILKVIEKDNSILCFEKLKHFDSETAFTGISFDKHHTYILYAVTIDSKLTIVNLNTMTGRTVKLKQSSDTLINNWNSVIGVERCTYMHVESDSLSLYDKRTNSCVSKWNGVKQMVDTVYCNNITVAKHCEDSPSLYFATDHHTFLMDTRVTKKRNLKTVQRWTHGLKCAPTYMSIAKADNNKELITLSSQWCEDTCVISNYADSVLESGEGQGVTMPYHPPNILNVLGEARLKMLCFDIHNPIEERITASTTGLVVVEQGENYSILTQNSLGDIFARHLYPEHMESFVEDESVQKLHEWSQSYKVERKIFEVSDLRNMSNVWTKLKRVPDSYNFGSRNKKQNYNESKIYEAFEKEEVIPELLDAWENDRNADDSNVENQSLLLNLHYEDSDEE